MGHTTGVPAIGQATLTGLLVPDILGCSVVYGLAQAGRPSPGRTGRAVVRDVACIPPRAQGVESDVENDPRVSRPDRHCPGEVAVTCEHETMVHECGWQNGMLCFCRHLLVHVWAQMAPFTL